jgi:hypothetical protein
MPNGDVVLAVTLILHLALGWGTVKRFAVHSAVV